MRHFNEIVLKNRIHNTTHTESGTRHLMFLLGDDFAYSNATADFSKHDNLLLILNKYGEQVTGHKIRARYSTPSYYFN